MSAWARPGVQCVCIAQTWRTNNPEVLPEAGPAKGARCVIASVEIDEGGTWLTLKGFNDLHSFSVRAFRPLLRQSEAQDLAVFYSMLDEVGVEV